LSLLTETGAVGLGLFLALLATWSRDAWRIYRNAGAPPWAKSQAALSLGVLGVYLCQSLFHELSYTPLDNSLVFFLVGVTMSLKPLAATTSNAIEAAPAQLRHTAAAASC
jgi:O-antigen ligase